MKSQQERIEKAVDMMAEGTDVCSCCLDIDMLVDDLSEIIQFPDLPLLAARVREIYREDEDALEVRDRLLEITEEVVEQFWDVACDNNLCDEYGPENMFNAALALIVLGKFDFLKGIYRGSVAWALMLDVEV